ncbi:GNAT family N-acetyltransferase [Deinococcus navajonensis]|uniref:GNAT family N-acetyltransferase n=1 Tax=Deinococcus navajonensis TaxID=309884 RepID=A0ABV8XGV3_9DEIO
MPVLVTPRLLLLPLTRTMLEMRLRHESFTLTCPTPDGALDVAFCAQWPGDPLPMFPGKLARLGPQDQTVSGSFVTVTRQTPAAVGQLGVKGPPDGAGVQEIGYGFLPEVWGQGYATEAVAALAEFLLAQSGIKALSAQTAVTNAASARVLEKTGFVQTGTDWDEEDGHLLVWARQPGTTV